MYYSSVRYKNKSYLLCFLYLFHLMFLFYFLWTAQSTSRNRSNLTHPSSISAHPWSNSGGVKMQTKALNPTSSSQSSSLVITVLTLFTTISKFFLCSRASIWLHYWSLSAETFPLSWSVYACLFSVTLNLKFISLSFHFSVHLSTAFSFRSTTMESKVCQ